MGLWEAAVILVHKGSIAIDGISLTTGCETGGRTRSAVWVYSHTIRGDQPARERKGDQVHVEATCCGKYVEEVGVPLPPPAGSIPRFLKTHSLTNSNAEPSGVKSIVVSEAGASGEFAPKWCVRGSTTNAAEKRSLSGL